MKLKPTSFAKLRSAKIPILYNFSEQIIPKPHDWDEWTHVTGYWFRDQQHNTDDKKIEDSISPDLRSFLQKAKDDQKKVIYIGFGSVSKLVPHTIPLHQILMYKVRLFSPTPKRFNGILRRQSRRQESVLSYLEVGLT